MKSPGKKNGSGRNPYKNDFELRVYKAKSLLPIVKRQPQLLVGWKMSDKGVEDITLDSWEDVFRLEPERLQQIFYRR